MAITSRFWACTFGARISGAPTLRGSDFMSLCRAPRVLLRTCFQDTESSDKRRLSFGRVLIFA